MILLARLVASAFSGLLLYASFQPTGLWWAASLGMAIFALSVSHRRAVLLAWVQGLTLYLLLLPWIGVFVGAAAWIALAVVQSLYSLLFGFGLKALLRRRGLGSPVWIAAWFVATEMLRSSWPFGGFPWGRLAWGQVGGPIATLIRVGGPATVTFAVVLLGCALGFAARDAWALRSRTLRQPDGTARGGGRGVGSAARLARRVRGTPRRAGSVVVGGPADRGRVRRRVVAALTLALVATGGIAASWASLMRTSSGAAVTSPTEGSPGSVSVAAVQGNVPRLGLDFNEQRRAVLDNHARRTEEFAAQVARGAAERPQVVIWPENASDINPFTNADARRIIEDASRAVGAPILVGTVTPEHNAMVVWTPEGPQEQHVKRFLQPFGEYMPLRDLLRHVSPYVDRAGNFQPGHGNGVVQAAGIPLGVATCYEVSFDGAFRSSVRHGAQLLTSPTNNATFGFTDMTYQQLAMSRMRAMEYDRALVVAATSGVSAIVLPDGQVEAQSAIFRPALLQARLPLRDTLTLSARIGPGLEWVLTGLGCVAVATAGVVGRYRSRPQH